MALHVRCFIDGQEFDPPINVVDISTSIVRDVDLHGIGAESTTIALNFIGAAANYIENLKDTKGLKAQSTILLEQNCGDDSGEWEELIKGALNIAAYSKTCGDSCLVSVPLEMSTCETVLKNRFDQSVDMDKATSFDGITTIPAYAKMGIDILLPTKELDYMTYGFVDDAGDVEPVQFANPGGAGAGVFIRPDFANEKSSNIQDSALSGGSTVGYTTDQLYIPISPEVLYNEPNAKCFEGNGFIVNGRLKGTINFSTANSITVYGRLRIGEINPQLPFIDAAQDKETITFGTYANPNGVSFDWTITPYDWVPKNSGADGVYLMLVIFQPNGTTLDGNITFDKESFVKVETLKHCPPTRTKAYLVHEALSHAVESVTDNCVRVKSEYYGRTDSQPFAFPADGCGGLRFVTSGLKIRNAANPTFFVSPQDLIQGLQDIDNVGMGLEPDPDRAGFLVLRVESLDYFYRDKEILRCPAIPSGKETIDITKSYSKIEAGYKKWETQANFGLDEFNSTREYRTSLTSISTALDITSILVAGEYAIEVTRQQQYVETSEADTTYDDETFIVCLVRAESDLVVEQGNVTTPANIFSPSSIYNYRLTPVRNLMRWFRSIAASYPNLADSDNRLFFNAGTGNIIASGILSQPDCRLEANSLAENQDILVTTFADQAKAKPLWRNENFSFEYPMSLMEYNTIKADPYGYISYQCGNGAWKKGWLMELEYNPFEGMANITLKKAWQS